MYKPEIIYEDNHIIAVNKPGGMLVQGDETGDKPLSEFIKEYIKVKYKKPGDVFLGVVHRIDRPVSGAVIFARTSKALERMNKIFAEREVEKNYWALVKERPDPFYGTLVHYLDKDHDKNVTKALDGPSRRHPDAKKSELYYELILSIGNYHLLAVKPTTGRSHQIRAQLSRIGIPIKGDMKYGYPTPDADGNISLHCRSMKFTHPVTHVEVTVTADPPANQIWNQYMKSI